MAFSCVHRNTIIVDHEPNGIKTVNLFLKKPRLSYKFIKIISKDKPVQVKIELWGSAFGHPGEYKFKNKAYLILSGNLIPLKVINIVTSYYGYISQIDAKNKKRGDLGLSGEIELTTDLLNKIILSKEVILITHNKKKSEIFLFSKEDILKIKKFRETK